MKILSKKINHIISVTYSISNWTLSKVDYPPWKFEFDVPIAYCIILLPQYYIKVISIPEIG